MSSVTLLSLAVLLLTKTITFQQGFMGFSHPVIWLLVFALFIAQSFVQTGLGRRIGYWFIRAFGKRTLGLGYGLLLTDALVAPAVPSVTARSAGIVLPIMQGVAASYDSHPHAPSAKKIGAYLNVLIFQATVITSAMFMTAMAANPLLAELVAGIDLELSWGRWALAAVVPGIVSLALLPIVLMKIFPPELKETPEAPILAQKALQEMGPMSMREKTLGAVIILLLSLWVLGSFIGISAATAGLIGLSLLLAFRVLDWNAVLSKHSIWETFIWFAILLSVATALNKAGVMLWLGDIIISGFSGMDWRLSFPLLALVYFYTHYLFASSTAHVTAMFVPFLTAAIALGAPPYLAMFILLFFSNLFGGITHYSLAPAPALHAAGYVELKDWWRVGFIISVFNILIWSTLGVVWWRFLGFW
jgi:DASS family divalent anion:Na+ symporter